MNSMLLYILQYKLPSQKLHIFQIPSGTSVTPTSEVCRVIMVLLIVGN
jgi:hypothetical protein